MGRSGGLKINKSKGASRSSFSFKTGLPIASATPDPNDPLFHGYPNPTEQEVESAREVIKLRNHLTEPLSANDKDIISKSLESATRIIQYNKYRLSKEAQRKKEADSLGRDLDLKMPTATEYGAQYDLAPETVSEPLELHLKDQEKARLPNGEAVIGPADISVSFKDQTMITEVTSAINVNPAIENYYQNDAQQLSEKEVEDIRKKWLMKRANILYKDSLGKKPLDEKEARFRAEREFADRSRAEAGFDEDFDEFVSKKTKELIVKTKNNQELSPVQASDKAKKELARIDRLGGLKFKIEVKTDLETGKHERFPFETAKGASSNNLTISPSYLKGLEND